MRSNYIICIKKVFLRKYILNEIKCEQNVRNYGIFKENNEILNCLLAVTYKSILVLIKYGKDNLKYINV